MWHRQHYQPQSKEPIAFGKTCKPRNVRTGGTDGISHQTVDRVNFRALQECNILKKLRAWFRMFLRNIRSRCKSHTTEDLAITSNMFWRTKQYGGRSSRNNELLFVRRFDLWCIFGSVGNNQATVEWGPNWERLQTHSIRSHKR